MESLPAVSGYEVLGTLGRGGMGVVYRARHHALNRVVALKMILAGGHAGSEQRARFKSEVEAVARLQHPNIVLIYEVGEADGLPFCALEFVAGGSLADKLGGTPLPPPAAAGLVRTLAGAIQTAHAQGIVHRDLKPANVLLTTDGVPKISDFGLAKHLGADSGQTESGSILGTPSYMAPEQALGRIRDISPATDVYALGAILYECLTGRPPFKGATVLETLEQVRTQEPVPPAQLQPNVPRDVETICLKCLQKDPTKRYGTAAALAEELRRFHAREPIQARPVGTAERLVRWCQRNPLVATLTGAVAFVLLTGTAVAAYFAIDASLARNRADVKAKEALELAKKATEEGKRANREADSAWAAQYTAHMNLMASDWESAKLGRIRDTMNIYLNLPPGRNDLRGWEWHYQERLCNQDLRTMKGHPTGVGTIAFSPDGSHLASANWVGSLTLWDTRTGKVLRTLPGDENFVWGLAFSPDGKRIAAGNSGKNVKLWDVETGKDILTFTGHEGGISGVAFSPDGKLVASTSMEDNKMKVWDAHTGKELRSYSPGFPFPWGIAFSPDGDRLAAGFHAGRIYVWNVHTGEQVLSLQGHTDLVLSVAFSPDGRTLASTCLDKTVRMWDLQSGAQLRTVKRSTDFDWCVTFSPDGTRLASANSDGTVLVWEAGALEQPRTIRGHADKVYCVAFSPDGTRLASAGLDGTIKIWNAGGTRDFRTLHEAGVASRVVVFSPDKARLASANWDGTATIRDVSTGQKLGTLRGHQKPLECVAFSPDGTRLATGCVDQTLRLWDVNTGLEIRTLTGHTGAIHGVAYRPDGKQLASASEDGSLKVWNADTGAELRTLKGRAVPVRAVTYHPDGRRLASASSHGGGAETHVMMWDADTGLELFEFKRHTNIVYCLTFSPDGARLASASADRTVKLWGADSGAELRTLKGHTNTVHSVAFSPDGTRVASASLDGTAQIWDADTGQALRLLKGTGEGLASGVFSADGAWFAAADGRGEVLLWDARALTPPVKAEVEAVGLLDILFDKPLPKRDVRASLEKLVILDPAARRRASELVDRYQEETDPQKYYAAAWPVVRHPSANVHVLQTALVQLEETCQRAPSDEKYRIGLAVAHYRLGKFHPQEYQQGMTLLSRCDQVQPATLSFLAMTQHQLGQKDQARTTLARLREVMKGPRWSSDAEAKAFLGEAADLIEGNEAAWADRASTDVVAGEWAKAALDFEQAVKRAPNDASYRLNHIFALVGAGDSAGYQKACTGLVRDFAKVANPGSAVSLVWACSVGRHGLADYAPLVSLAEKTAAPAKTTITRRALGAALYRAGKFDAAVERLQEATALQGESPSCWLFLALAHRGAGRAEEAGKWLKKADRWIDQARRGAEKKAGSPDGPLWRRLPWTERLGLESLRREAAGPLQDK